MLGVGCGISFPAIGNASLAQVTGQDPSLAAGALVSVDQLQRHAQPSSEHSQARRCSPRRQTGMCEAGLTVGEFAQVTHLSVKALRHYHAVGLLLPTTIDPDTGYR